MAGQSQTVCVPAGSTLAALIAEAFPDAFLRRFAVAFVNGAEVASDAWASLTPGAGDFINLSIRPGDADSGPGKFLRTVLQIAVIAAAAWVGGMIGGLPGSLAAAAITMGGNLIINSLIPIAPLKARGEALAPVYTVTGARNQARTYAPMPLILGEHRFFPPLYGQYVQETIGNDVYLRVPFCLGPAPVEIDDLKIGETPLSSFTGVEVETRLTADAPPHTLYVGDPTQNAVGAAITTTATVRNTSLDADEIEVVLGFRGGLGGYDDKQRKVAKSVIFEVLYRPAGSSDAWVSHRATVPQANAATDDLGIPYRPDYFTIESDLDPYVGRLTANGGAASGNVTVTRSDPGRGFQFPIRFAVPRHPAGYQVSVRRLTAASADPNTIDAAWWEILGSRRSYADPFPERGIASVVLRIKASEQLNNIIETFNCIAKPVVPLFSAGSKASPDSASAASLTTTGKSRNPAEIVLNLYRGSQAARPRPDARIDWPAWAAFAAFCEAQGLHYDEVIDTSIGRGELARRICASAHARPLKWGGRLTVVIDRDRGSEAPAQTFTPRNVANLRWQKAFPQDLHAVRIAFNNADNGWQADEVTLYLDGYDASNATKIETLQLPGKTDADEVRIVGRQFINNSLRQTERFTFDMDAEALTCRPGAYAVLLHDAIGVGLGAARIATREISGGNVVAVVLDAPVDTETGDTLAARWRSEDGAGGLTVGSEVAVTRDATNPNRFVLVTPLATASAPIVGDKLLIGRSTEVALPVLVRDVRPDFGNRAQITVIPYAGERFTPDGTPLPPHTPMVQLPIAPRPATPVQLSVSAKATEIALSFFQGPSPRGVSIVGFDTAVRETGNAADSWQDRGMLTADARLFAAPPGNPGYSYDLRVVAVGRDSGGLPVKSDPLIVTNVAAATVPAAPTGCNASFTLRESPLGSRQLVLSCDWDPVENPDVLDTVVELLVSEGPDVWAALQSGTAVSGSLEIHGLQVGRDYQLGFRHMSRRGIASARTLVAEITADDVLSVASSAPWTGVTGRPGNLAGLTGSEAINNALVPVGANGLVDTEFRFPPSYWASFPAGGLAAVASQTSTGGLRKLVATGSTVVVNGSNYINVTSSPQLAAFPCKPGDLVGARLLVGGDNVASFTCIIIFRDAATGIVGTSQVTLAAGLLAGTGEETTFNAMALVGVAPAGTVRANIDIRAVATTSAPILRIAKPVLCVMPADQTVVPPYAPGREHELGANVTESRVAFAFSGQAALATLNFVTLGANLRLADGVTSATDTLLVTSLGVAFGFAGQAALATLNFVTLGTNLRLADGVTSATDTLLVTSLGVSSGFSGQGALATLNAVGAANLAAGVGKNGLIDTEFRFASTYWQSVASAGSQVTTQATSTNGIRRAVVTGTGVTVGQYVQIATTPQQDAFPVAAGEYVEGSAWLGGANVSSVQVFIDFRDASGVSTGFSSITVDNTPLAGGGELSTFRRLSVIAQAPAGTVKARLNLRGVASTTAPVLNAAKPMLARALAAQTEETPWNPGFDGEPGANVTETRVAFGFNGQAALATANFVTIGTNLRRADGTTVATEAMVVTSSGVSSGFAGQAALATQNFVTIGTNLRRADGTTVATEAMVVTSSGVASGFAGQAALATLSFVTIGTNLRRADGTTVATEGMIVTSSGVSSGFSGQGALATLNAVGAANLAAGVGKNGLIDTEFRFGATYWVSFASAGSAVQSAAASTNGIRRAVVTGTGVTVGQYVQLATTPQIDAFPIAPGEWLEASVYVGGSNISAVQLFVEFRNSSNGSVSYTSVVQDVTPSAGNGELSTFERLTTIVQAPASTVKARILVRGIASTTAPVLAVAKPLLARALAGQTEATPWNPGFDGEPGANVTETRVASGFSGQAALATQNFVAIGTNLRRADGTTVATEAMVVTSSGVASGFAGQAALATQNFVLFSSTVRLADGTTVVTDAMVVTSSGVASGFSGQGSQATANSQRGASYSGTPTEGSWWADTTTDELKYYTAGAWVVVAAIPPSGGVDPDLLTFTKNQAITNVATSGATASVLATIDVNDVGAGGYLLLPAGDSTTQLGSYLIPAVGCDVSDGGTWVGKVILTEELQAGGTEYVLSEWPIEVEDTGTLCIVSWPGGATPWPSPPMAQNVSGDVRYRLKLQRTSGANNITGNGVSGKFFLQRVPG